MSRSKSVSGSEEDEIEQWLMQHEAFAESFVDKWLARRHSRKQQSSSLSQKVQQPPYKFMNTPNVPKHKKRPVAELRKLDKNKLFVELLTDVVSPDFDINHLTHKILVNILLLTNADRSSLFLVEGTGESQILVSRLFDVTENTKVEDAIHDESDSIKMPVGVGIAGMVAKTGETINLKDAYEDPRFNREVDLATGYQTKSILCMPIKTTEDQVIGVAQVINKDRGAGVFTNEDEEEFRMYLNFCAIGLVNVQLLEQSFGLSRKLHILLYLAKGLFEDTTKLDEMIKNVMLKSMELIPCEQVSVLLLESGSEDKEKLVFSRAFQIDNEVAQSESLVSIKSLEDITDIKVAEYVARNATPVIMSDVGQRQGVVSSNSSLTLSKDTKSILCVPIFDKDGHVLGIVHLTNRLQHACFTQGDLESLEVFATFCGLGIRNVMLYEEISVANARNKVAFDILSYHASSSPEDANRLMQMEVPTVSTLGLTNFKFDDLALSEDETVLASVRIFMDGGFLETFKINTNTLYRWVLTVKKNYRPVTYHNWRHAFNVAQMMFAMLKDGRIQERLSKLEQLALLIACFCHDLDHRGTNNAFQKLSGSVLAELYSTSTMEHHHFDHCIMILNSEGNQILNGLSHSKYNTVIKIIESAILSTDLALYFKKKQTFQDITQEGRFDWKDKSDMELLRGMIMTACDVAAITKPWKVQKRVATMVASEFFEQGDLERKNLQVEPMAMMDRKKRHELPKMQVNFIDFICMPLYKSFANLVPDLQSLQARVEENRKNWQLLADDPRAIIEGDSSLEITMPPPSEDVEEHETDSPETPPSTSITSFKAIKHTTTIKGGGTSKTTPTNIDSISGPVEGWRSSTIEENPLNSTSAPTLNPSTDIAVKRKRISCSIS